MSEITPPRQRTIIPPEGGWKSEAYYEVIVAFNRRNICHQSILYTGFLEDGEHGGYSSIWNPTYEDAMPVPVSSAHYIRAVRIIMQKEAHK